MAKSMNNKKSRKSLDLRPKYLHGLKSRRCYAVSNSINLVSEFTIPLNK